MDKCEKCEKSITEDDSWTSTVQSPRIPQPEMYALNFFCSKECMENLTVKKLIEMTNEKWPHKKQIDQCANCEGKCQHLEEQDEDYDLCCKCNDDIPSDEYCADCFSDIASNAHDLIKGELERQG